MQMTSAAAVKALVRVDNADAMSFPSCDLSMDKGALLEAMANSIRFKIALSSVNLLYSKVSVFWAASSKPTPEEVKDAVELVDDTTIFDALGGKATQKLFIHVELPGKAIVAAAGERCCWHCLSCCALVFTLIGAAGAGAGGALAAAGGESRNAHFY